MTAEFNKEARTPARVEMERNFFEAVRNGYTDAVDDMIRIEPSVVHWHDDDGLTALMIAATNGNVDLVEVLLDQQADANVVNKNRSTALMFAAYHGHRRIVDLLIQHGADVNALNVNGSTALMSAAWQGHGAVVVQLMDAYADPDIKDAEGITAAGHAKAQKHPELTQLLLVRPAAEKRPQPAVKAPDVVQETAEVPVETPAEAEEKSRQVAASKKKMADFTERLKKGGLI